MFEARQAGSGIITTFKAPHVHVLFFAQLQKHGMVISHLRYLGIFVFLSLFTMVAEHSDRASYEMLSEDKAVPEKRDGLLNGVDFQVSLRVNAVVSADILPCKHPFLHKPPECPGC